MPIGITDEHEALRVAVRRFVETRIPPAVARAALDADTEKLARVLGRVGRAGLARAPRRRGVRRRGLRPGRAGSRDRRARAGGCTRSVRSRPCSPRPCPAGGRRSRGRTSGWRGSCAVRPSAPRSLSGGRAVLGGALADVIVVEIDGTWCALATESATVTELASVDPTRRVARSNSTIDAAPDADARLDITTERVHEIAAVLLAAEAIGVAQWCVDTAAEYAKVRVQFGRPIGQFQGVKHRCADMLAPHRARARGRRGTRPAPCANPTTATRVAIAAAARARVRGRVRERQGLRADARRHRLHVGARRAPLPAAGDDAAPARRRRPTSGASAPRARRWPAAAARSRVDLARRGRGASAPRSRAFARRDRGPRRPTSSARGSSTTGYITPSWPPPWGRDADALELLVIEEEFRAAKVARAGHRGRRVGAADPDRVRHDASSRSGGSCRRCAARSSGASCSASPAPAPTSRRSSTTRDARRRRLGAQRPEGVDVDGAGRATGASASPAPTPTRRSTTASRASWST